MAGIRTLAIALAWILATSEGAAQERARRREETREETKVPAVVSDATVPGYEIDFAATVKDKVATASGTWQSNDGSRTYEFKFSGPIASEPDAVAELFSLDGLPKGATAKLTLQQFNWGYDKSKEVLKELTCELARAKDDCDRSSFTTNGRVDGPLKTYDLLQEKRSSSEERAKDICEVVRRAGAGDCQNDANLTKVNLQRAFLVFSQAGDIHKPTIRGFSGSFSRKKFDFLTKDTLEDRSESHNAVLGSVHAGRYSSKRGLLLARLSFSRSWSAGQSEADEICRPITNATAARCKTVVIGAPSSKTAVVLGGEWRKFLPGGDVAFNLKASYDFKKKVGAFELPVYFLKGGAGLNGGANFGWRSDKKELTFGVFVGAASLKVVPTE